MKNKRGTNLLFMYISDIIFLIAILAILLLFTNSIIKREDVQKQIITKQTALLLDASNSGTELILQHANITVSKKDNIIEAKTKLSFIYDFFNPSNINLISKNGETKIEVF